MKGWMDGDLGGVDPRAELALLRETVAAAASAGEDTRAFWRGLAALA